MSKKYAIPENIKKKILLAGELYEKARAADSEAYEWLRQMGLVCDDMETQIEEDFIESVRMGDGGGASSFIAVLEELEVDGFGVPCVDHH